MGNPITFQQEEDLRELLRSESCVTTGLAPGATNRIVEWVIKNIDLEACGYEVDPDEYIYVENAREQGYTHDDELEENGYVKNPWAGLEDEPKGFLEALKRSLHDEFS